MIGEAIAHYQVLEEIVEGGMGLVFRGEQRLLGREVAIKTLRPECAGDADLGERFRREASILARLRHPNIVSLYDFFEEGGRLFMVMEYVGGETFAELIRHRPEGLPWRQAAGLTVQVLAALEHAHGRGIVHRDIKPANLLVAPDRSVRVLDFGVAQSPDSGAAAVEALLAGTLRYMSPEQIRGRGQDGRSDLYSLALVLYELLSGGPTFADPDEHDLIRAHTEVPPPPLRPRRPDLPPELEHLILKALAKKPEDRFDSAWKFRHLLEGVLRETSPWDEGPPVSASLQSPAVRSRPAALGPTVVRRAAGERLAAQGTRVP